MKSWSDPEVTDQVRDFYRNLEERASEAFEAAIARLIEFGPALGRPTVAEIDLRDYPAAIRQRFPHLKELRPTQTVRVLFTFGPDRVPVLLYAGDKRGDWTSWYPAAIKEAARLYSEYLREVGLE